LKFRRTRTNDNAKLAENVCHIAANVLRTAEGMCFGNGCFNDNEYTKRTKSFNLPKCTNFWLCAVTGCMNIL
jgi:hypothetical protein